MPGVRLEKRALSTGIAEALEPDRGRRNADLWSLSYEPFRVLELATLERGARGRAVEMAGV